MVEPVLPPDFLGSGPVIIGATGGSGTRVIAKIISDAGVFIGTHLNASLDAIDIAHPAARWIDAYMGSEIDGTPRPGEEEMLADLKPAFADHIAPILNNPGPWGWKSPRSIYLLPFYRAIFPAMRFIHVLRDGRDMAFSKNQGQLKHHGDVVLKDLPPKTSKPSRSIALWSRINLRGAEFGERELRERYLRIRFEDLCRTPVTTIESILSFIGATGDAAEIANREIAPPETIERWRSQDATALAELHHIGETALRRFGYL